MQSLTASVYECSLAVEAHMICDLLARAGISSRVEGEFLAGAMGELPLGSTIKVRVDPSQVTDAKRVIEDWQRLQRTDPEPAPPPAHKKKRVWSSTLWFAGGIALGAVATLIVLRTPYTQDSLDLDGDGVTDETYSYSGGVLSMISLDHNADGKIDERHTYDVYGVITGSESDPDFDGILEWRNEYEDGEIVRSTKDANQDGKPEQVGLFRNGTQLTNDIYDESGARIVVRELYRSDGLLTREIDKDGDGVFERRVEYDRYGEPVAQSPAEPVASVQPPRH
jgi:Putative prokaryotic signal transducing protein